MAATYEELLDYFIGNVPGASDLIVDGQLSKLFNDYFNQFYGRVAARQGTDVYENIDLGRIDATDLAKAKEAGAAAEEMNPGVQQTSTPVGLEEGILNTVLPGILSQINADQGRAIEVEEANRRTTAGYDALRDTLGMAAATVDPATGQLTSPLLRNQHSVLDAATAAELAAAEKATQAQVGAAGTSIAAQTAAAQKAYQDNLAAAEAANKTMQGAATTANQAQVGAAATANQAQLAAATTANQEQLQGLSTAISAMQGSLSGSLAAQAAALQKTVAQLTSNLTTLDATQRAALAKSISEQQANLEKSVADQRAVLLTEVEGLRNNATAAATTRRRALEQQLSELNAAQAPMNEARVRAAESLVTAVNIGLQRTQDQLTADNAKQGYMGGSTMQDAALARATIDARQNAAGVRGAANVANAGDIRDIARYGAGAGFGISDALAGETQRIGDYGVSGAAGLDRSGITGQQALSDMLATENRNLTGQTALNQANIGAFGANTELANTTKGIADELALKNALAVGTQDLTNRFSTQKQDLASNNATYLQQLADAFATEQKGLTGNLATQRQGLTGEYAGQQQQLAGSLATQNQELASSLATQQQDAANRNAAQRVSYAESVFPTALNAAQVAASTPAQEIATKTSFLPYTTAGTDAGLNTLFRFASENPTPPTPTATMVQPNTGGNALGSIGSSLVGAAFQVPSLFKPAVVQPTKVPTALAKTSPYTFGSTATTGPASLGSFSSVYK